MYAGTYFLVYLLWKEGNFPIQWCSKVQGGMFFQMSCFIDSGCFPVQESFLYGFFLFLKVLPFDSSSLKKVMNGGIPVTDLSIYNMD